LQVKEELHKQLRPLVQAAMAKALPRKASEAVGTRRNDDGSDQAQDLLLHYERVCLGAALEQNDVVRGPLSELNVYHFLLDDHRTIFAAIVGCVEEQIPVDASIIANRLLERGQQLNAANPLSYLEDLTVGVVIEDRHLRYAAQNVIRAWKNRQLGLIGDRLLKESLEPGADPEVICARLEKDVARITPRPITAPVDNGPEAPMLDDAALHGVAGEIVSTLLPQSEVCAAVLLMNLLVAFGSVIGRHAHTIVGQVWHYPNLYYCCVGESSKSRKGTSWNQVLYLFSLIERVKRWRERITNGLSSGEGLISLFADNESGAPDKRQLIVQDEFASVLRIMSRPGNTLSANIRSLFDTGSGGILTKNNPLRVRDAHLSLIVQITPDELRALLDATESSNGFGNRFLYGYASRHQYLPEGGFIEEEKLRELARKLDNCILYGEGARLMQRDEAAKKLWDDRYRELTDRPPGMLGQITSRAVAICLRLSMLYAIFDETQTIKVEHLKAALALWEYGEKSAKFIWGDSIGDPTADKILTGLRQSGGDGLSRTQISLGILGGNSKSKEIGRALAYLQSKGLAHPEILNDTGGRDAEVWKLGPRFASRRVQ
jgi:hypothetical protein